MSNNKIGLNITSETAGLNAVILHTPGKEVENMTPANAHKALYSDILSLAAAHAGETFLQEFVDPLSLLLRAHRQGNVTAHGA